METKTTTVFPEFASTSEGTTFMLTYVTPVGFHAEANYYDAVGSQVDVTDIYHETAPQEILTSTYSEGDENTADGILYVNEGFLKYNKEV